MFSAKKKQVNIESDRFSEKANCSQKPKGAEFGTSIADS